MVSKNICIDISSEKPAKDHTRILDMAKKGNLLWGTESDLLVTLSGIYIYIYRIYTPVFLNDRNATSSRNKYGGRRLTNQSQKPIDQESNLVSVTQLRPQLWSCPVHLEPTAWKGLPIYTLLSQELILLHFDSQRQQTLWHCNLEI